MINLKKFLILSTAFLLQSCYYASNNETIESKIFGKNYAQETNSKVSRRTPEGNPSASLDDSADSNSQNYSTNSNVKLSSNDYDAYQHYQASTPPKKAKRRPILNLKELNELMDREATISIKERAVPEITAESNLNEVIEYNKAKKKEYKKPKKKVKVLVVKKDKNEMTKAPKVQSNKKSVVKKNSDTKPANNSSEEHVSKSSVSAPATNPAQASAIKTSEQVNTDKAVLDQVTDSTLNNKANNSYVSPVTPANSVPVNQIPNEAGKQPNGTKSMVLPPVSVPAIPVAPAVVPVPPKQPSVSGSNIQAPVSPPVSAVGNLKEDGVNAPNMPPVPTLPPAMESQNNNADINNSIQTKLNDSSEQNAGSSNEESNRFAPPMPPVPGAEESGIFDLDNINKFLLDIYYSIKFAILTLLKSWFRFD